MIRGLLRKFFPHLAADRVAPAHNGLLQLLEARRGRGKSYTLMSYVQAGINSRTPVYCNFGVNRLRLAAQAVLRGVFPDMDTAVRWVAANVHYVSLWDDVLLAEDALILLDEASRIFDSRERSRVPAIAYEWLQQSRKLRLTIVMASQSFDWLDVRVRQLADTLWLTRKESDKKTGRPVMFHSYGVDPWAEGLSDAVLRKNAHSVMSIPFNLSLAQCYDSWEIIALLSGKPSWENLADLGTALGRDVVAERRDWLQETLQARDVGERITDDLVVAGVG